MSVDLAGGLAGGRGKDLRGVRVRALSCGGAGGALLIAVDRRRRLLDRPRRLLDLPRLMRHSKVRKYISRSRARSSWSRSSRRSMASYICCWATIPLLRSSCSSPSSLLANCCMPCMTLPIIFEGPGMRGTNIACDSPGGDHRRELSGGGRRYHCAAGADEDLG